jgi:tetratricopeptide (TPR) repeat protein
MPLSRPRYLFAAAVLTALAACSHNARAPSAEDRAARLNAAKSRAAALLKDGDYRAALATLEPLAAEASADPQVFVMLGDAHAHLDEYDAAVGSYESAIRLEYTNHEAHLKLATLLMTRERIGRALTEFELAIKFGDRQALTHYNYGLALHEMGRDAEALHQWRLAYEMDPDDARYAEAVGIGLSAEDPVASLGYFETARTLGADSPSFHNNFGLALVAAGRQGEAVEEFEEAVSKRPSNEGYRFNLAAARTRSGDFERAVGDWRGLIAEWGARWSYSVYLAKSYQALGKSADAIAVLERITADFDEGKLGESSELIDRVPPRLDEAYDILFRAYRATGDASRALSAIRRAVELDPENLVYLNNYGVVLAENGMLTEARSQWRKVLQIDGDNATARENLSRFSP